ncbi:MAG: tetratricopeptide repeat protein [Cyclobacteriaceae bacterium]
MYRFLLPLLLLSIQSLTAQKREMDSLKQVIATQKGVSLSQSLNELSWYYKSTNPDSAILLANQSLNVARETKDPGLIAASYNSLGNAYQTVSNYDTAILYLTKSLSYRTLEKDSVNVAKTLNNLGICADEKGEYEKALTYYFDGLKIAEGINDPSVSAMLISNIGIVYKKQKDYEKVLEYYEKALNLYVLLDNQFGIAVTTGNIGSVYLQLKDFDKAINYSQKAENLYRELGYTRYIPYTQGNAALAFDSLGDSRAEDLYLKAIAGHRQHNNQYELAYSYKNIGSYFLKTSKPKLAEEYLLRAVEKGEEIEAKEMLKDALNTLAESYAQRGKFGEAYAAVRRYENLTEELFQANKTKQIYELQTAYETEKKEQQIALQQAEIASQQTRNRFNIALIAGLIVVIILLGALLVLLRSRSRRKQAMIRQEMEIELRESQIEASISSQEKERSRFAKDLHDGFGQLISILNLNLKSLESDPESREKVFEESAKVLEEMYQELKGICFNLMPQTLIKNGITSALNELASRINVSGQVMVQTDFFGLEERLTDVQEISLYRITQEWVNNVIKYSDADKINIQITKDSDEITLMVEDNGSGFDISLLKSGKGNGWRNMHARANLIKGELELDSTMGIKGNTLIVNAAVKAAEESEKNEINV